MTLEYTPDRDGYLVHRGEHAICRVRTKTSQFVPAGTTPDGKETPPTVVDKPLAQAEWQIDFYHGAVTPALLKELLDCLPKPEPDHGRGSPPAPPPEAQPAPPGEAPPEEKETLHKEPAKRPHYKH